MAELTLEGLAQRIDALEQQNQALVEENKSLIAKQAELEQQLAEKPATGITIGTAKKSATIPDGEFSHLGKKYRFTLAAVRLPGDPARYTAEEISVTAGKKDGLFAKVLAIKGQKILVEQQ